MILAIDPGNIESAYCVIEKETYKPIEFGKVKNHNIIDLINKDYECNDLIIEMIASYGMAVGKEVFDTCVWIGRFIETALISNKDYEYIYRKEGAIIWICY